MNAHFTAPRSHRWPRAVVAIFVTATAALTAWILASVAAFSEQAVVITVMVLAFVASWIVTNASAPSNHRITTIRVRARSH